MNKMILIKLILCKSIQFNW